MHNVNRTLTHTWITWPSNHAPRVQLRSKAPLRERTPSCSDPEEAESKNGLISTAQKAANATLASSLELRSVSISVGASKQRLGIHSADLFKTYEHHLPQILR